jgi:hypothetical protein
MPAFEIDCVTPEEAGGILVDRQEPRVRERRQRRCRDRMAMQDDPGFGCPAMGIAVDAPGGGIGRVGALHDIAVVCIERLQVACPDGREMLPLGVHQEPAAIRAQRRAEMIADRFVPPEPGGEAECGGQIDPQGRFIDGQGQGGGEGALRIHALNRPSPERMRHMLRSSPRSV